MEDGQGQKAGGYSLFYRALSQKRLIILRSLLIVAINSKWRRHRFPSSIKCSNNATKQIYPATLPNYCHGKPSYRQRHESKIHRFHWSIKIPIVQQNKLPQLLCPTTVTENLDTGKWTSLREISSLLQNSNDHSRIVPDCWDQLYTQLFSGHT